MEKYIDLEDFSKENPGKGPEKGRKYQIKVDREKYKVGVDSLKGSEILELAGKKPFTRYQLNQKFRGGLVEKVGYEEVINFTTPGVERFMTIPLDQTEGLC